ncbi:hypothetical protein N7461_004876 [Penicillium sp. DV-2018c]|nr:hypothetical protein N7461_004876 [Penicillium sp. DV-2018c]
MSVGVVLAQFEALVTKMELIGLKLCNKRIRPTADQVNEFQNLHTRFKATLPNYETGIQRLSTIGTPDEQDVQLADHIRAAKNTPSTAPSTLTSLKRNLVLIFMGPKTFQLDSKQVKTRNRQTEVRCETLRSQHSHVILMWAIALQPSTWKTSVGMTEKTFEFLTKDLGVERLDWIPPQISEIVLSLAAEEPMNTCDSFISFAENISRVPAEQQRALKRRRTAEIAVHSTEPEAGDENGPPARVTSANTEPQIKQHASNGMQKMQQSRRELIQVPSSDILEMLKTGSRN